MIPNCQPCITAGKGLTSLVEPFKTSHPGKVKILQIAYSNSYTCEGMQSWKSANGFTHQILTLGNNEVEYYGGMGMPTIVVVGPKDRYVHYKKQGYSVSHNANITNAINNSLAGLTGLETYKENLAKIYPRNQYSKFNWEIGCIRCFFFGKRLLFCKTDVQGRKFQHTQNHQRLIV
jgi:hypothetical protein